jgi:ubiquinone/menaquinone biosynthesis C-methylase UbiE
VGIDWDPVNLEISQSFALNFPLKKGSYAFQQGDGNFLPLKDSSVDFLICRGVLHYLYVRQALQEMARVLKPGGRLFVHAVGLRSSLEGALKCNTYDKLHRLFVIFNGAFHFLTERQITVKYKKRVTREIFLTTKSLKTMERLGIKIKSLESFPEKSPAGYYLLVAEKS